MKKLFLLTLTLFFFCATVNALTITIGTNPLCVGDTTVVNIDTIGGSWSSSNTAVATVNSFTGLVTGIAAGTSVISYIISSGEISTIVVTIDAAPNAGIINGVSSVCVGSSISLTDSVSGGVWTSTHTSIATIGSSSGIVTGVAAGVDTIRYTVTNACGSASAIKIVTVNANPGPISGITSLCVGSTTSLSDGSIGLWSSGNIAVATVGSGTGIVSGVSVGTATITDYGPSGCNATIIVTVNAGAAAITSSNPRVCVGLTISLSDATAGGTWSSGNTGIATVGSSSGVVTGVAAGTVNITYTVSGCSSTIIVTVYPIPDPISGLTSVCVGSTISLTDTVTGGGLV